MWYYRQPANPKMTQALIAEVPEFDLLLRFLAAVEEKQQPGSGLSQQQLRQSAGKNSQTNHADVSIWNPRANTDRATPLMHMQRHRQEKAFSSPPT